MSVSRLLLTAVLVGLGCGQRDATDAVIGPRPATLERGVRFEFFAVAGEGDDTQETFVKHRIGEPVDLLQAPVASESDVTEVVVLDNAPGHWCRLTVTLNATCQKRLSVDFGDRELVVIIDGQVYSVDRDRNTHTLTIEENISARGLRAIVD